MTESGEDFRMGRKIPISPGAVGVLNAELTTPVSSDGTVWHGRERMRLIGKAFFLIDG
jgi:hypothetical protein